MARKKRKTNNRSQAEAPPPDRRQHPRAASDGLPVDLYLTDDPHAASARDISEGGVFIEGTPSIGVGDEVIVQIQPAPEDAVYLLRAEVRDVRADRDGRTSAGMRFIEPEADLVAACRSVVQARGRT